MKKHKDIFQFILQLISIAAIAIFVSTMQSCGAREKHIQSQTESVVQLEKKDILTSKKEIKTDTFSFKSSFSEINIKPKDSAKPSSVEFQENKIIIQNADVTITNEDKTQNYNRKSEVLKDFKDKTDFKASKDSANTIKDVQRDAMIKNYQIVVFVLLGLALIYFVINRKTIIAWVIKKARKIFLS